MVYALVQAAKTGFTDQELQELGKLLDELMNYFKLAGNNAKAIDAARNDVILRARELRSRLGI